MREDENGSLDYEREEGERRYHERYKTRLNFRDDFYPPAWHEQEVTEEFYPEEAEG